ncbi:hypothetical protein [Propionispora hippei]|uniref:Uncharacterized protein n=1 Tax=Propionispora hippei DSM 15287 TaxID=1123003 RepID=A0A1M6DR88_9FIRM|nr:hypothetical protein [Propionispora hippei]SHI75732.1 hypothetical protein SAMN02745170_00974 [Propionispora hippei DSM 15287]
MEKDASEIELTEEELMRLLKNLPQILEELIAEHGQQAEDVGQAGK